jgi:hypothetical protein
MVQRLLRSGLASSSKLDFSALQHLQFEGYSFGYPYFLYFTGDYLDFHAIYTTRSDRPRRNSALTD